MNALKLMFASLLATVIGAAGAAVSPDEARQLQTTLTPFGAEKAANADGSIPAYSDAALPLPAGYKAGSGKLVAAFPDEQPLVSIDAKNVAQYADQLSEGTKALIQRFPDFRVDVYPSHRTARYPGWVTKKIEKNAVSTKLSGSIEGDGVADLYGPVPFPIPKNGYEVLWNAYLAYRGVGIRSLNQNYLIDGAGNRTDLGKLNMTFAFLFTGDQAKQEPFEGPFHQRFLSHVIGPATIAGTQTMFYFPRDYSKQDQLVYLYTPGLRRVRVAPEFAYDTPIASYGGALNYDQVNEFAGRPDRYDFKLVGKKELIIPYNTNKISADSSTPDKVLGRNFINPDYVRWEKHRVWVVEATLKQGKRHVFERRTFYFDEDSWAIVANDNYDHGGKLYHVNILLSFFMPDTGLVNPFNNFASYNMVKNSYLVAQWPGGGSPYYVKVSDKLPDLNALTPEAIQASGIQ